MSTTMSNTVQFAVKPAGAAVRWSAWSGQAVKRGVTKGRDAEHRAVLAAQSAGITLLRKSA